MAGNDRAHVGWDIEPLLWPLRLVIRNIFFLLRQKSLVGKIEISSADVGLAKYSDWVPLVFSLERIFTRGSPLKLG